ITCAWPSSRAASLLLAGPALPRASAQPASHERGQKVSLLTDFKKFLFRGNVVDLAVAVIIGTAFTAVVKALVADILTPIIALIFGKPSFQNLSFTINGSHFLYGDFINNLINFVSIAAAVFFFVVAPIKRLMAP